MVFACTNCMRKNSYFGGIIFVLYRFCRIVAAGTGVATFVLSKNDINSKRYEIMKARQRIKESNTID